MDSVKRAPVRVNPVLRHPDERRLDLNGAWAFRLDPNDRGLAERWFDTGAFPDRIEVPGTWQGQGFGGDGKEAPWNFWLEARLLRATYTGTGWYARRFGVPASWNGSRVWLNLGGAHPSADVWLNGTRLGEHRAPFVPFGFEITDVLRPDAEQHLVCRVHEESRALGLAFSFQGNWSGLYRGVELTATGPSFLDRLWVHPDGDRDCLAIKTRVGGLDAAPGDLRLHLSAQFLGPDAPAVTADVPVRGELTELELPVPSPRRWSPDAPNLYRVDARLTCDGGVLDALSERTGFVTLGTDRRRHFLINGQPYYMRGSADFGANPESGSPDPDRERWRRKLPALRAYGYNYMRCQSFVPTPEYLDVADEVGLLVQSEMGMLGAWGGSGGPWHVQQWPQPTPDNRAALKWQWDHVVMRDVNHPSANLYCMSNELQTPTLYPRIAWQCYRDTKEIKPSAFVIWTDGGYHADLPGDFVNDEAPDSRGRANRPGRDWEGLDHRSTRPLIQHEFRWWVSYPDVRIAHKYSGAVRPFSAEIAFEAAARHGLAHLLPLAAVNSQRLQFVEAKGKMEACRRNTPWLAGISHFQAQDLTMSPQGILDEFYERKYADAAQWRQTNGDTVVLSSLGFADRVVSAGETLRCALSVSDFSHPPLGRPMLEWSLVADTDVLASGEMAYAHEPYTTCPAGQLEITLPETARARALKLRATVREDDRVFGNEWDLWLLPREARLPVSLALYGRAEHTWLTGLTDLPVAAAEPARSQGVRAVLTERIDDALVAFARSGGRVILAASEGLLRPFDPHRLPREEHYFFSIVANDPPFEHGHTGTILVDHPMLGELPHEGFADLQFFRLIGDAAPLDLEPLGLTGHEPVLRVMHTYPGGRPLAYLLECALGDGRLIISALNLDQSLAEGRYLLAQLGAYAVGDLAHPASELSAGALAGLISGTAIP
jgi:hypothetical protein